MSCNDLNADIPQPCLDINSTPRLPAIDTDIFAVQFFDFKPGQQRVAIVRILAEHGNTRNGLHSGMPAQLLKLIDPPAPGFNFLQRDNVGIQLSDDVQNALKTVSAVGSDTTMNVIGGKCQCSDVSTCD